MNTVPSENILKPAQLKEICRVNLERIRIAKRRQTDVFAHKKPDKYPAVIYAPLTTRQEELPNPDFAEAFHNRYLMLCSQLRKACTAFNSNSDVVPSIRANMGTANLLSCVGLEQDIFPDKMPWLQRHLSKKEAARLDGGKIKIQGTFQKGLEYTRYFTETMGNVVDVYCLDTQGILDLAHLLLGDDLFFQLYDDPPFVHHLLQFCTELNIRAYEMQKKINGEKKNESSHSNTLYAKNIGVRICEDTTALLNEEQIHEFAMPYTRKVAQYFGGAWVHYCGRNDMLTEAVCEIEAVKGLNFGHVPGKKEDTGRERFENTMQICKRSGTVYVGPWPRYADEKGEQFLERMYSWAKEGVLIPNINNAVDLKDFYKTDNALEYWYSLQGEGT